LRRARSDRTGHLRPGVLAADHGALADQAGWYNGGQNASVLDREMMVLSRSKKAVMDGLSLSTDLPRSGSMEEIGSQLPRRSRLTGW